MPKYEDIADTLRARINDGTYATDTLLPNQTDLVNEFKVSRMTIKKAITILSIEGLVFSKRGFGTKVLNHAFWDKEMSSAIEYRGLSKDMERTNRNLTSQVITFEVEFPNSEVQTKLNISAQHPVYKIIRLRLLEGSPFILEHTYMPTDLVPGLTREILNHSIYSYIENDLNIHFAGAFRNIQAAKADHYDLEYLNCKKADPILEVEQVVYLENGRPIEYSRSRNRFDQRAYSILDVRNPG